MICTVFTIDFFVVYNNLNRKIHAKNYRLVDCSLYVTLEPCTMCAGVISAARLKRVVYGATDIKSGAVESGVRFFETKSCNHKPLIKSGVLADNTANILKEFFQIRRK